MRFCIKEELRESIWERAGDGDGCELLCSWNLDLKLRILRNKRKEMNPDVTLMFF